MYLRIETGSNSEQSGFVLALCLYRHTLYFPTQPKGILRTSAHAFPDIERRGNSQGVWQLPGCGALWVFLFDRPMALLSFISLKFLTAMAQPCQASHLTDSSPLSSPRPQNSTLTPMLLLPPQASIPHPSREGKATQNCHNRKQPPISFPEQMGISVLAGLFFLPYHSLVRQAERAKSRLWGGVEKGN